ncbi:hypothetical protein [Spongiibacter marinus]|uniref:hypothetical protein n=1 Tax=Spongiibacter marinus TaxID=354246 RepID=UPI00356539E6
MSRHPSLKDILEEQSGYEWMSLSPEKLTIRDWADAENVEGDRCNMEFFILCGPASSEYGTYSFNNILVNIYAVPEKQIQALEGKSPLGLINYYEEECPTINLNLSEALLERLLPFIASDLGGFRVRVSVPKWKDESAKCLPLLSYQVFYEREKKI